MMNVFDLAIAWNWEFDADFVAGIEYECSGMGISTYRIDPKNLHETLSNLQSGKLGFRAFFDRASDADADFLPLVSLLSQPPVLVINPHPYVVRG